MMPDYSTGVLRDGLTAIMPNRAGLKTAKWWEL
jgi:hypothetical protein